MLDGQISSSSLSRAEVGSCTSKKPLDIEASAAAIELKPGLEMVGIQGMKFGSLGLNFGFGARNTPFGATCFQGFGCPEPEAANAGLLQTYSP